MTITELQQVIDTIKGCDDSPTAHSMERRLYVNVLRDIAACGDGAQEKASLALTVNDLPFPRWFE